MNSIITDNMECCFICGSTHNLNIHHVFFGTSNRKQSDKYGLIVPLCVYDHTGSNAAVHNNRQVDLYLKRCGQYAFEENHTREEFIKVFGKSYL